MKKRRKASPPKNLPSIEAASAACKAADLPWLKPEALEAFKDLPKTQGRMNHQTMDGRHEHEPPRQDGDFG